MADLTLYHAAPSRSSVVRWMLEELGEPYDLVLLWHAQAGHRLAPKSTLGRVWYPQKASVSFEDILRTLRHATWQERIFSDPALDAHTRKILQPFVEWAKGLA